jgi:Tol biopolymer transport system component
MGNGRDIRAPSGCVALGALIVLAACSGATESASTTKSEEPTGRSLAGEVAVLHALGVKAPIYRLAADGSTAPRAIGPDNRIVWAISWSPDGSQIAALTSSVGEDRSVIVVDADTEEVHTLLSSGMAALGGDLYQLAWAPSGRRIAVVHNAPGSVGPASIALIDLKGKIRTRNLVRNAFPGSRISWSPDSRHLVYRTGARYVPAYGAFAVVAARSGRQRTMTHARVTEPAWSPRGSWIAVATRRGIALTRPTGDGVRLLTRGGSRDTSPTWSADGRWIAYVHRRGCDSANAGCTQDLYLVRPTGGPARRLRRTPRLIEMNPEWTDGKPRAR